ncbi:MAG: type II toxin-antitoxin system HicA family toxin [Deltaproteobacteria bacterium]|nr:type II toxin-antitoxin system HicA family toxin [Deltaproteobacteria bacterium]MBW2301813.1 type II toxin-antitoxin system HicA family toxin [Deltaproteobacteria bacterium]
MVSSVSLKELIRRFRRLGYLGPFSGGKHQFMIKGRKKIRIPNPHGTKDIHVSLLKEILRQAGVTEEEWNNT